MGFLLEHSIPFTGQAWEVFRLFAGQKNAFFLDSSLDGSPQGNFSYVGFNPFKIVEGRDLKALKAEFQKYRIKKHRLAFPAGAVGYLGYDGRIFFGFYDGIIAFDHARSKLIITSRTRRQQEFISNALKHISPPTVEFKPFKKSC